MTGKTHLVIPDSHAHPEYHNKRAEWLGKFMYDLRPDVVVNIGDMYDMPSMSSYDRGKKSFWGRSYNKDLMAGQDFDDRLWHKIRKNKKKKPYSVFIEGNHENRLKKAIDMQPELEGTIGFGDFDLARNYNDVIEYTGGTPGIIEIDGIYYSHYFISGVLGRPIGGEHQAYSLLTKQFASCTVGHTHTTDFAVRTLVNGQRIMGMVAGVFQDYEADWAGERNKLWWRGVIVKRNVENGCYEPEWVSLDTLKKKYG
jgi:hypothetical protein